MIKESIKSLLAEGPERVHVLADFDGTLTKKFYNGQKRPSLISILRDDPRYLGPDYAKRAHALYDHFGALEHDLKIPLSERKEAMMEWWITHKKLLIEVGLTRQHVEEAVRSGHIDFRDHAFEFVHRLDQLEIPLVILSASGLGDAVPIFMESTGCNLPNVHYIVNSMIWDAEGRAIDFETPTIHSLNKDETAIDDCPVIRAAIKDRVNVLLLGDSVSDVEMVTGFPYQKLLKIGFVDPDDPNFDARVAEMSAVYDYVITDNDYADLIAGF